VPVGVVAAQFAGDNALSGSEPLALTEAGRMLGILDLLAAVILACVDSFNAVSRSQAEVPARVAMRGGRRRSGRRLKFLL
jgi:hypothetical protein